MILRLSTCTALRIAALALYAAVLLAAALTPAGGPAKAAAGPGAWVELCTPAGMVLVRIGEADPAAGDDGSAPRLPSLPLCPVCLAIGGHGVALTTEAALPIPPRVAQPAFAPPARTSPGTPLTAFARPAVRAPPVLL